MKNQWRELLETLAEKLYGPGRRVGRRRAESAPGGKWADGGAGGEALAPPPSTGDGDTPDGGGSFFLTRRGGGFLPLETAGAGSAVGGVIRRLFSPDRVRPFSFFMGTRQENRNMNVDLPVGAGPVLTGQMEEPETAGPAPGGGDSVEKPGGAGDRVEYVPLPTGWPGKTWEYGAAGLGRRHEEAGISAEELDRAFQRDARRYDGGFSLY